MPDPQSPQPARVLGTLDAACVVIGAIIGVGIFRQPSAAAAAAGDATLTLAAWALAGGIALCGALVFAELGARFNSSGAQYGILRDAYGPMPAFLFVFCNATAIQAGAIGVIAVICAENLGFAFGRGAPEGLTLLGIAVVLILGVTAANMIGVRWGSRIQNFTVFCKVLTLMAVAALAAIAAPAVALAPVAAPKTGSAAVVGVLAALVPALFSYGGWQQALWISGEVREPRRTLPRAIIGGVVLVVAAYVLANWAYLRLLGHAGVVHSSSVAADAVGTVFPGWGPRAVGAAVAISAFGVLNAQLLAGPRLIYGMARDGRFFEVFGRLSGRNASPVAAILLLTFMALVLLGLARVTPGDIVGKLTDGVVFVDTVFFALTGVALMIFRRRESDLERAEARFRIPLYPVVPLLFIVGEFGVLAGALVPESARTPALFGLGWIGVAALMYVVRFRGK